MNWKLFITVFISSICLLFPYNIIGCSGGEPDPYDYYVSFFQNKVADNSAYQPFYYTNAQFLYDSNEPIDVSQVTSAEWSVFAGKSFSDKDAYDFVCRFNSKDLSSLYYHLEKNQPLKIPDSVKRNGMTNFFLQQKNLEALGYILYAKQVEPYVTGSWNDWESVTPDNATMSSLIKNGLQLWKAAKADFIKLRYAYQIVRLAHYNKQYANCIQFYNELLKTNSTKSVLQELSLGLKAGAEYRLGMKEQAALTFSQLFASSNLKKISNYMSFNWCVNRFDEGSRKKTLALCKDKTEKASMLSLFALGSYKNELNSIVQVSLLAPQSTMLPVLVTREINKLEEFLFTPSLLFSQGKEKVYVAYTSYAANDKFFKAWQQEAAQLQEFCIKKAASSETKSFWFLAASHIALLTKNYPVSKNLLEEAKKNPLNEVQKDQWFLTNLLLTINAKPLIDAGFEKELLPSIQWLEKKATIDNEFAKFYRRLFADILLTKYKSTKNRNSFKYLLCLGVADKINQNFVKNGWGYYAQSLTVLRNEVRPEQIEELIKMIESKNLTAFETFLISNCRFNKDDLNDLAGTTWLRQYNFKEAEKWFKKVPAAYYVAEPFKTFLAANPFADLLLDTHAPTSEDTVKYTKLLFTKKMIRLQETLEASTEKEKKALLHYELAKGFYHISYWGNSWLMVQYDWSNAEYGYVRKSAPDYYDVKKATEHYRAAFTNTANKNFQAKCLYMAAKCEQKLMGPIPTDRASHRQWLTAFDKRNSYYSTMVNSFTTTPFYKEAFTTCSYLRDFIEQTKR